MNSNTTKTAIVSLNMDFYPRLGLGYLATYLKQKLNDEIEIHIVDNVFDNVFLKITEIKPDILGISAMTIEYADAIDLAVKVKEVLPECRIIVGGVHISTLPNSLNPCFELGVLGEGEETLYELVSLFNRKKIFAPDDLAKINGIVFWDSGQLRKTFPRFLINPLDKVQLDWKYLDRHLVRKKLFALGEYGIEGYLFTSRGCPYDCEFCSTKIFWNKVRFFSVDRICEEILLLKNKYNVDHIQILDDLFTQNKKRLREIISGLKKAGVLGKVKFSSSARANVIDEEICDLLKEMNVVSITFGFESGSERILKYIKGNSVTVDQNKNAIKVAVNKGIKVMGGIMLALPTETIEDMKKTVEFTDFARKNGVDIIWPFVLVPFPGTRVWDIARERGIVSDNMDWRKLSLWDYKNPLLLEPDIPYDEFWRIMSGLKRKLRYYNWKKALQFFIHSPIDVLKEFAGKPLYYFKILVKYDSESGKGYNLKYSKKVCSKI